MIDLFPPLLEKNQAISLSKSQIYLFSTFFVTLNRFFFLSAMTIYIFYIPTILSKPECVFSHTKFTISEKEASLYMTTIEALHEYYKVIASI